MKNTKQKVKPSKQRASEASSRAIAQFKKVFGALLDNLAKVRPNKKDKLAAFEKNEIATAMLVSIWRETFTKYLPPYLSHPGFYNEVVKPELEKIKKKLEGGKHKNSPHAESLLAAINKVLNREQTNTAFFRALEKDENQLNLFTALYRENHKKNVNRFNSISIYFNNTNHNTPKLQSTVSKLKSTLETSTHLIESKYTTRELNSSTNNLEINKLRDSHKQIDNNGAGNCAFNAYAQMLADNISLDNINEPDYFETLKTIWNNIHAKDTINTWEDFKNKIKVACAKDIANNNNELPSVQRLLAPVLRDLSTELNNDAAQQILTNKTELFEAWKTLHPKVKQKITSSKYTAYKRHKRTNNKKTDFNVWKKNDWHTWAKNDWNGLKRYIESIKPIHPKKNEEGYGQKNEAYKAKLKFYNTVLGFALEYRAEKNEHWSDVCQYLRHLRITSPAEYNQLVPTLITEMEKDKNQKTFSPYLIADDISTLRENGEKHPLHMLTDYELPKTLSDLVAYLGNHLDSHFGISRQKGVSSDMFYRMRFLEAKCSALISNIDRNISNQAWKKINFLQKILWYIIPGYKGYRVRKLILQKVTNKNSTTEYRETEAYKNVVYQANKELTTWWQAEGLNKFWDERAKNGEWSGGPELGKLASFFGTNLRIYKPHPTSPYIANEKTDTRVDATFTHTGTHWMYHRPNTTCQKIEEVKEGHHNKQILDALHEKEVKKTTRLSALKQERSKHVKLVGSMEQHGMFSNDGKPSGSSHTDRTENTESSLEHSN